MQVNAAGLAVVRKSVSVFSAGIAVIEALVICGGWKEGERVGLVERVGDCFGHFEAFLVEKIVAECACVDDT